MTKIALGALLLLGCGEDSHFGDRCESSASCGEGGFCCEARECPGGFCTEACETDDDCRENTVCIELTTRERVCLLACSTVQDCTLGTGLECVEREGTRVCANE